MESFYVPGDHGRLWLYELDGSAVRRYRVIFSDGKSSEWFDDETKFSSARVARQHFQHLKETNKAIAV